MGAVYSVHKIKKAKQFTLLVLSRKGRNTLTGFLAHTMSSLKYNYTRLNSLHFDILTLIIISKGDTECAMLLSEFKGWYQTKMATPHTTSSAEERESKYTGCRFNT